MGIARTSHFEEAYVGPEKEPVSSFSPAELAEISEVNKIIKAPFFKALLAASIGQREKVRTVLEPVFDRVSERVDFQVKGIENLPEDGRFIMAANHPTHSGKHFVLPKIPGMPNYAPPHYIMLLDHIMRTHLGRPFKFITNADNPMVARLIGALGYIPVDGKGLANEDRKLAVREALNKDVWDCIEAKGTPLVCPEGHFYGQPESNKPYVGPFRSGIAHFATPEGAAPVPVVPVALTGLNRAGLTEGASVEFLPAVHREEAEKPQDFADRLRSEIFVERMGFAPVEKRLR